MPEAAALRVHGVTPAITLRHPPGYQPERRYAYEVVMVNFLGLSIDAAAENRPDVELRLADGSSEARLRVADVFFAIPVRQWLTNASFPRLPLERISPERIS